MRPKKVGSGINRISLAWWPLAVSQTPLKFIQAGMLSLSVMAEYSMEAAALRHHSHLLLKLFPGLSFKNGSGWHFQSILGLSGYLNYRPPAEYLFWVFSSICFCRLASCGLSSYLIGKLLLKVTRKNQNTLTFWFSTNSLITCLGMQKYTFTKYFATRF